MVEGPGLAVGLVGDGSSQDEALAEMLDQAGVCYERDDGRERKFPAVLLATHSEKPYGRARALCSSEAGIVIADQKADVGRVASCLSGTADRREDSFGLEVTVEERKLVAALADAMASAGLPLVTKRAWPKGAPACLVMSHDIDWLSYSPFHRAVLEGGLGYGKLVRLLFRGLAGKDYGWNIPETVRWEGERGAKSTFLFRSGYGDAGPRLRLSLEAVREAGSEVALHAADGAYHDAAGLREELEGFQRAAGARPAGIRHHILRNVVPTTWQLMAAEGLEYDATFAHNRFFGFRGGTCHPYRPLAGRRLPLVELPTSFMDWTALHRGVRGSRMLKTVSDLRALVARSGGVMVANYHNTYLNEETFPDVVASFKWLLEDARADGSWVATAAECASWWKARSGAVPSLRMSGKAVEARSEVPLEARLGSEPFEVRTQ